MHSGGVVPSEGAVEEREKFESYWERIVDRVGDGYKLFVLGKRNELSCNIIILSKN